MKWRITLFGLVAFMLAVQCTQYKEVAAPPPERVRQLSPDDIKAYHDPVMMQIAWMPYQEHRLVRTKGNEWTVVKDEETDRKLSMWVETDAVKSKSEAAALFIKEGLKARSRELDELTDAIDDVKKAKERLQSRARKIFGKEK